ncbi:putative sodium-coupled neutral amino acid transporter 10 [Anopheles albimanus]|uniref:Amino acid transporter transmembrane domain-containing protein n=1 Tax=Anopheles albimanus TaxID=7167 RepID=A0A182FQI4_ANOAL|nr:putative sodium-coupled neutral amino acid transporter 10 [Anopheles albimanus]
METNSVQTVTLTNSIIGVGILSMPFCFQKCGIVLSIVLLLLSSYVTRLVCSYMVKSAIISRRKNFEQIAFYAFGSGGKLLVELCVVGYLLGTCIAYFVVVGDLGPQITAKILSLDESSTLRSWVMIVVTIVCIIPLGMLRNVDSLASVCSASLGFYLCLVLKVMSEASNQFQQSGWLDRLDLWKWSGILQCMPIFTMALSCQMQIFEVYATMPTTSLDKMSRVIRQSTNICTLIYVAIGFFGYVAFNGHRFSGNILVDFSPSFVSDVIKIGFVLSVAFSFPLAIFPCRVSLYSLLYKRSSDAHLYIPESKFRPLTVAIVMVSLIVGLLIPSIEVVIGLVGSTIGVAICLIIPAACYMTICKTNISEKKVAQVMIAFGFLTMVLGTYANLQAIDSTASEKKHEISTAIPLESIFEELHAQPNVQLTKGRNSDKLPQPQPPENIPIPKINKSQELPKNKPAEPIAPVVEIPPEVPVPKPKVPESKPVTQQAGAVVSNQDAVLQKEQAIAVEEKQKIQKEISELKNTKKVLEEEVKNIKEELVKKNQESEQLKKVDQIIEKVAAQSNGKVSKEEDPPPSPPLPQEVANEPPKNPDRPSDPIVKLLTAGGTNKTIPLPVANGEDGTNFVIQKVLSANEQVNDADRVPMEGGGEGELPVELRADPATLPAASVRNQSGTVVQSEPKYGALAEAKKDEQQPVVPVFEAKAQQEEAKEKAAPLPPLPVEVMPVEDQQAAKGEPLERKSKESDEGAAGKRDLLAMRFKRESELQLGHTVQADENCPKPGAANSGVVTVDEEK